MRLLSAFPLAVTSAIATASLTLFSALSHATSAPAATCYLLAHGENGQGSENSLRLPHLRTKDQWTAFVMVTNTSDKFLNVILNFNRYDGSPFQAVSVAYEGLFDASNSPFDHTNGGAILKPGETARVSIFDDNYDELLVGSISWQADACIETGLLVSARSHYFKDHCYTSDLMFLNNGFPF